MSEPEKDEAILRRMNYEYRIEVRCLNCSWSGEIWVPKGQQVKYQSCPNCGVKFSESAK